MKQRNRTKILIVGHARHGKDTVAEILTERIKAWSFTTSSQFACKNAVFPVLSLKYGYTTEEECFNDRMNHRKEWYDLICEYNNPKNSRLAEELLKVHNIYVGMRSKEEYLASAHLFDMVIWVDASERLPLESSDSFTLSIADLPSDTTIIKNNKTLRELEATVCYDFLLKKVFKKNVYIDFS